MLSKNIIFFGQKAILGCDANCSKAWGVNNRPKVQLSDDPDDYEFLADHEVGEAPADLGTYEGGHAKPQVVEDRLNKWCCRECERSRIADEGKELQLPDFSKRLRNKCP